MAALKTRIIRTGLDALYLTRAFRLFERQWAGMGLVFMLHHIKPSKESASRFHPNGILEITPEFLATVIGHLKASGVELISLGQAVNRLVSGESGGRFACFTIDDGYRDNFQNALPVFRKFECPFAVFVATGIVDGTAELWWLGLEEAIAVNDRVTVVLDGTECTFETVTDAAKQEAYEAIYWPMRAMPEREQRAFTRDLCGKCGVDLAKIRDREAMNWHEIRRMADDPLVTIGAHTVDHFALAKLEPDEAMHELTRSRERIAEKTGRAPEFFCYPYGDPASAGPRDFDLAARTGYRAAFTTRKGMVFAEHASHLHALPRVSLNGDYQALRYVDLYLSGAPFALWNRFRRIDAA
jgi:peptidoglycan/xylan/chitin deacetylase (PgdA/CDA1 family)